MTVVQLFSSVYCFDLCGYLDTDYCQERTRKRFVQQRNMFYILRAALSVRSSLRTVVCAGRIQRSLSIQAHTDVTPSTLQIASRSYDKDDWTNVTPKISSYIGRNIYAKPNHPISIVRQQIVNYFYKTFVNSKGNPQFSVFDALHPVVSVHQNFDQLLIPADHVSRAKADCYYVNRHQLLRAHTTAHQVQ